MSATRDHRYAVSLNGAVISAAALRLIATIPAITTSARTASLSFTAPPIRRFGETAPVGTEELLVASLSACHKLWYLHLAAEAGIIVTAYTDRAEGVMEVGRDNAGRFKSVVLRPTVTVATGSDVGQARALHKPAHEKCFIANSANFPVECEPEIVTAG